MEEKKKKLVSQLLAHYNNDKDRVRSLGEGCKSIGFSLSEEANIDAVAKHPEAFFTLMTYADFGILGKLTESLKKLKE